MSSALQLNFWNLSCIVGFLMKKEFRGLKCPVRPRNSRRKGFTDIDSKGSSQVYGQW